MDETQSAFIANCLITNNVILGIEAFHSIKDCSLYLNQGFMALKLNMMKAYDRVEWGYLEWVLKKMVFTSAPIRRIMMRVTSVSVQVLVNGTPSTSFTPTRGIREGDPLSLFLFLLCSEGFSTLIRRAESQIL